MVAVLPAKARSKISPPPRGLRRTLSPGLSSMPPTLTESSGSLSSSRCQSNSFIASLKLTQSAQCAMQFPQLFGRQTFGAFKYLARACIHKSHLAFLFFRERHNPQQQNLVNLCPVE